MEEIVKSNLIEEIPKEEDNDKLYWKKSTTKTNNCIKCTVWRCTKCHPHIIIYL